MDKTPEYDFSKLDEGIKECLIQAASGKWPHTRKPWYNPFDNSENPYLIKDNKK